MPSCVQALLTYLVNKGVKLKSCTSRNMIYPGYLQKGLDFRCLQKDWRKL